MKAFYFLRRIAIMAAVAVFLLSSPISISAAENGEQFDGLACNKLKMDPMWKTAEKNLNGKKVNFYFQGSHSLIGCDLAGPSVIEVEEMKGGALRKGDKLYFKIDGLPFYEKAVKTAQKGGLDLSASVEDGMLVLTVEQESTDKSYVSFQVYGDMRKITADFSHTLQQSFPYGLYLAGGNELKDNAFDFMEMDEMLFDCIFTLEKGSPKEIKEEKKEVLSKDGSILFTTYGSCNMFVRDTFMHPASIDLKETGAGQMKKGDKIYFAVPKMTFCSPLFLDITGDMEADYSVNDNGDLAVEIKKESTVPSEISMNMVFLKRKEEENFRLRESFYYPLWLVGGDKYENNMFSNLEDTVLDERFLAVRQETEDERIGLNDMYLFLAAGSDTVYWNDGEYHLKEKPYLKNGSMMVPLREFTRLFFPDKDEGLEWNEEARTVSVLKGLSYENYSMTVGDSRVKRLLDGRYFDMGGAPELKNGVLYVPLRGALWYYMGPYHSDDFIHYFEDRQTVILYGN